MFYKPGWGGSAVHNIPSRRLAVRINRRSKLTADVYGLGCPLDKSAVHIHSCSLFTSLPRLLSIAASPVKSDGGRPRVFSLCIHYAFIMQWLGAKPPIGL